MNARPSADEYFPHMEQYISRVPNEDIAEVLARQLETTLSLLRGLSPEQADFRYAPGKWSIKQVVGHLIDNERVWSYRLLRIARNDAKELPGYDEGIFAAHAPYADLPLADIEAEYTLVRRSTLAMLKSLPHQAWLRTGVFHDHPLSVRAAAYVIAGHEDHHLAVIAERYLAV